MNELYVCATIVQFLLSLFLFCYTCLLAEKATSRLSERIMSAACLVYLFCAICACLGPQPADLEVVEASWQRLPCASKVTIEHPDGSSETRVLPEGSRVFVVSKESAFK